MTTFLLIAMLQAGPPLALVQPDSPAAAPVTITLQDALDRAKQNDAQVQSAAADAETPGDRLRGARRRQTGHKPESAPRWG